MREKSTAPPWRGLSEAGLQESRRGSDPMTLQLRPEGEERRDEHSERGSGKARGSGEDSTKEAGAQ